MFFLGLQAPVPLDCLPSTLPYARCYKQYAYEYANNIARKEHAPVLIHVIELTQPVGHSTSGSHERYKTAERLDWEKSFDCVVKMKEWILENGLFSSKELEKVHSECKEYVKNQKDLAWTSFQSTISKEMLRKSSK